MTFNTFIPRLSEFNQIPPQIEKSSERRANALAWLTGILVLNNIVAVTWSSQLLYQAGMVLLLIFCLPLLKKITISFEMILLYVVCILSIVLNKIPAFYRIEYRLIFFITVTLLASPALCSDDLAVFRSKLFRILSSGCVVIVWLSVLGRPFGIAGSHNSPYYAGVTGHSMVLGSVSAIALITLVFDIISNSEEKKEKMTWKYIGVLLSIFCLFSAASRTAVIGTVAAASYLAQSFIKDSKIFRNLFLLSCCILITMPILGKAWDNVVKKNGGDQMVLSTVSREDLWESRWEEFRASPIFGTGFGTTENIVNNISGNLQYNSGQIEPGSSWLAVLSMTGILGGFAVLLLCMSTLGRYKKIRNRKTAVYLLSMSIFMTLEMCAEGFIYSAGSFLCFYVWLLFGAWEAYLRNENNILLAEKRDQETKITVQ